MKIIFSVLVLAIVHLNLNLAYADNAEDFMHLLETTHVKAIDVALIRLDLFAERENQTLNDEYKKIKFLHTKNRIELNVFIKDASSKMTSKACTKALSNLKADYKNKFLAKTAFPDYSAIDQNKAEKIFNYQVLLIDDADTSKVISCN
jgi:hypothetical protein